MRLLLFRHLKALKEIHASHSHGPYVFEEIGAFANYTII